ncbi:MAG: HAMP domain-containing histidine kinase, partial [Bacteroidaceae bacterium]|nr:HAMP domain-containing histidine kinase [Bacteroidaceae bacterium]
CFTVYAIFRQKRMTEIRNDFINNMTHEFKTPISTISLASQMLSDPGVTKSPAMLSHLSGIINDETKRLRFQVEKILQISMFNRRGGAYKNKEFDMAHVVEDVVGTFRLKVESAGGTIVCQVNAPRSKVYGDEIHLTNVVFNLLDNAVKYKSEERRLELNVKVTNDGDKIRIEVADNGIGIRKEDVKKIFDRFYRVHTGNRHDVKGFGLGLAYVRNVIDYHKGTIRAESRYGHGTRFVIELPVM